ncbi:MAG TPA: TonB-dependent receptor [Nevskiaceae bacterium]|nr:TonB-dependent receptor [Nevskiaceae bacterium]
MRSGVAAAWMTAIAASLPASAQDEAPTTVPVSPVEVDEPSPGSRPERSGSIGEIIVTAQRREESAQDVPISITVFDQAQLANANITNASDLATQTPSLTTNTRFGQENASFAIRGFTQDLRTTASVATYFAEVVAPRGQSVQTSGDGAGPGAFFDLQNVQVLKGPQGTLFGRNTTGGAVLIVPRRPTPEFGGYAEFSGGEFDGRRGQGVVNVPVSERFRLRMAVDRNRRDGTMRNVTGIGADRLADVDYTAWRLSALLDVTASIENYTIVSLVESDTNGYTSRIFACNPNPVTSPLSLLTGTGCRTQLDEQAASGRDGYYDLVSSIATPISIIREKRVINTTAWEVTGDLTFKNILAWGHLETENASDIFGTHFHAAYDLDPERIFTTGAAVRNPDFPVTSQTTWVEELQLQGRSFAERLTWQTGLYWENSRPDGFSGNNSVALVSCELATIELTPDQYNCFDPTGGQVAAVLNYKFKTDYLNRAAYAQATFDIADPLSLTAGFRYTWDRTEGFGIRDRYAFALSVPLPPTQVELSPRVKSRAPTGLVEMRYRPLDDVMLYAKYLRGYRQGSVNMAADPGVDTYDPEKVDTYEIGAKATFGGPLPGRFNIAAFHNDFTDMQLQTGYVSPTAAGTTAIFNAGKARIKGFEIESYLQLLDDVSLSLSFSRLLTRLLEQEDHRLEVIAAGGVVGGLTYTPIADVGDTLPFAPDHAYVASLAYAPPPFDGIGAITLGATWAHIGEQRTAASSATPFDVLDAYSLLNLNAGWTGILGSAFDLTLFGTNVLDEKYSTYNSGTYNALGFEARMMGVPRMVGARLRYRFGADAL